MGIKEDWLIGENVQAGSRKLLYMKKGVCKPVYELVDRPEGGECTYESDVHEELEQPSRLDAVDNASGNVQSSTEHQK